MKVIIITVCFIIGISFKKFEGLNLSFEEPEMIYQREFWNAEDPALIIASHWPNQEPEVKDKNNDSEETEQEGAPLKILNKYYPTKYLKTDMPERELQLDFMDCFHDEKNKHWPLLWNVRKLPRNFWANFCRRFWNKPYNLSYKQDCSHMKRVVYDESKLVVTFNMFPQALEMKVDVVKCSCRLLNTKEYGSYDTFFITKCSNKYFMLTKEQVTYYTLNVVGLYTNVSIEIPHPTNEN